MLLENSFVVPAPIERVWSYLLDVEKVVVCMPGAELTETIDDDNYKGKLKIKLGPVALAFAGKVTVDERNDAEHRVVLRGSGMEQRGKGRANATVTATAEATGEGTRVNVTQDLQIQGQIASMSRGMMGDVSAKLTQQFADCLESNLSTEEAPAAASGEATGGGPAPEPAPAAPTPPARGGEVKGFSLLLGAVVGALRRLIGRLRGRART